MTNVVGDLSILTTIPEKTLNKMFKKMVYCICESVSESVLQNKEVTEMDIGIGRLSVKYDEVAGKVKYHFTPSTYLDNSLENTYNNKSNLLEDVLNESMIDKFMEVYKDLC